MRTGTVVAVLLLTLGLPLSDSAFAKGSGEATVRHASVLRAKAAELRDQANHLRDGEGVKKPNVPRAKSLEKKADQLERQANKMDPQEWPPK
jgi:hypothetical protein